MSDPHRYSVSVAAAVIRADGRVLVIKRRDNGHWEPPGGILESGEKIQDGTAREVFEETGLQVHIEHLSGVYQNLKRDIISLVFRCSPFAGHLRTSDETTEFKWLDAAACRHLMSPAYAVRLTDAMDSAGPIVRNHDGASLK